VLAMWLLGKRGQTPGVVFSRIVAPVFIVLVLTGCAMGYYFWRITGSPFRIPYLVYAQTYDSVPNFPWQSTKAVPNYLDQTMKKISLAYELSYYRAAREHPVKLVGKRVTALVSFYLGPLLIMPVVALLLAQRKRFLSGLTKPSKARLLLLTCIPPLVGMALPVYFNPHYAAPLTGAVYALAIMAMRHLRLWHWHNQPAGRQMVRAIPVLAVALWVLHTSVLVGQRGLFAPSQDFGRSGILTQLQGYPGGQLVVVQYAPNHFVSYEWVYNDADIDAAKVVWARDMGAFANEELIRYFSDRRVWLLEADKSPPRLLPYAPMEENAAGSTALKP